MKADSLPPDPRSRNVAVAAFVIITVILVGVGYWYYQSEKKEITHEKHQILTAIGELKAKQIQQWRVDRMAEVERAAKDARTRKALSGVLTGPGDQEARQALQDCLRDEMTGHGRVALVFDMRENLLESTGNAPGPVDAPTLKVMREAIASNKASVSDFHRALDGVIHIDLAAPVPDDNGQPQGVLILSHEARSYLYPLLQSWPVPSRSAETLMVQREGNDVVFLNNLRHRADTALSLRRPLTDTQLPAVQAVLGKQGIFEGRDYRGTEVVSALLPISDSPWFIEAKVDAEEIFSEARYRASLISLIIGLFILLAAGLVALFYRQRQAGILNNLVKTERQKTAAQKSALQLGQQHQIILQTAMDGFVVVDMQGSIREANEAYRKMTGYSEEELLTMRISDLEASESREETGAHIQKVLAEGQDRFESRQRRKDGGFIDVEVSVQLRPEENVMVAFIHDITERKREQSQLVRSERMLRDSQETARIGHYVMDLAAGLWESSPTLDRLFGIGRDFVRDTDGWSSLLHPEDREKTVSYLLRCLENRETFRMDYRIIRPTDGESRWMAGYGDFEYDDSGKAVRFLGCIQDITEQKASEGKIKRLSMLYAALSETSQAIVRSNSSDELLESVCRIVVEQGEMKLAWIGMADVAGKVHVHTAYGPGIEYLSGIEVSSNAGDPRGGGPTGTAIREGMPFWCDFFQNDSRTLPWHEGAARFGWKSTAAIPLHLRGKTIGALTIYDDVSDVFDEEVRCLFVEMEKTIGFALDHFENEAERKQAEELLRSSEERYRKLVDNLDAGVVMHGPDTSVITSNPRALELLGLSEDQMAGRQAMDPEWKFLHEDHAPFLLKEFPVSRIIAEKKAIKNLVLGIVRPMSKDIVWVSVNGVPVFDQQGDILQVVVSFVDITERKQAEEALQESEKRMRAITDSAQDAIVMMDPEGRICYWNAAAERIFGYTSEEALGGNLHALIAPARYHAAQNAAFPAFLKSGQGNAVGKTLEMEALHKDGSEMSVELSLSAIQVQGDWHAVGFIRNITERKAMELALASTRDRLLLATKAGGVGIWDWDIVNNSLLWDDQMYLQYGITQDQFGGAYEAWAAGVHPEDKMRGDAEIQMAFRGEKEFDTEFRVLWPDGTIRNIRALALVQRDASGKPLRMIGTNWDITEIARTEKELKIALERAEAGNRAKSEFLNVMSHELRTPLNGVLGFAQLLSDTLLDNEQKDYVKTISQSGKHLLAIVSDILDFASIDAGTLAIHCERLAVAELVKSSEQAVIKSAMEKGISLQSIIEPNLPKEILGDDQRIRQILINLLGNAVKFTASGSVTLRVATLIEGGRQFLDFSVEDTGIGMLPETLGILFNPFKQADMRMNRTFGGAGLGLAISQRLAEAMDGKITVVSTVGKGSTFTFRLPIKKSAPYELNDISPNLRASGTESIAQERVLPGTGENRTAGPVLVVEDDKTNSMLAGKMLESLGYQVEFAADGAEALDAFVPGKYSAILMDIQMPVMNGLEATGKIRELESGTRVPIIALTAKVMPGDRERCLAAGMDDFLSKPFKKDELAAKLACVMQVS